MGLAGVQAITGFANQSISANLAGKLQKYRNQVSAMMGAMNERAILLNEVGTRDASMRASFAIAQAAQRDQGSAEIAAAASGTSGRNVDSQMRGLRRSALYAQAARKMTTRAEMRGHQNERVNNRVSTILNQDITVHAKPSVLMAGMGAAKSMFEIWNADRTPSERAGLGTDPASSNFVDWWE